LFSLSELPADGVYLSEKGTPLQRISPSEVKIGGEFQIIMRATPKLVVVSRADHTVVSTFAVDWQKVA
jgi:hypothetical protein